MAEKGAQEVGAVSRTIKPANQSTDTSPGDIIHRYFFLLKHLENIHLRRTFRTSSTQHDPNFEAMRTSGRLCGDEQCKQKKKYYAFHAANVRQKDRRNKR